MTSDPVHDNFLRLYSSALPTLRRYVMASIRDYHQAEDVLQQAALVLWKKFDQYNAAQSFVSWAMGVTRNELLHSSRSSARQPAILSTEVVAQIEARLEARQPELDRRRRHLETCLEKLPAPTRQALQLRYRQECSDEGIAERLERQINAVRILISRGRQKLAECMRQALQAELKGGPAT